MLTQFRAAIEVDSYRTHICTTSFVSPVRGAGLRLCLFYLYSNLLALIHNTHIWYHWQWPACAWAYGNLFIGGNILCIHGLWPKIINIDRTYVMYCVNKCHFRYDTIDFDIFTFTIHSKSNAPMFDLCAFGFLSCLCWLMLAFRFDMKHESDRKKRHRIIYLMV